MTNIKKMISGALAMVIGLTVSGTVMPLSASAALAAPKITGTFSSYNTLWPQNQIAGFWWEPVSGADGYEVSGTETNTYGTNTIDEFVSAGKHYWTVDDYTPFIKLRVRAYTLSGSTKNYGAWSEYAREDANSIYENYQISLYVRNSSGKTIVPDYISADGTYLAPFDNTGYDSGILEQFNEAVNGVWAKDGILRMHFSNGTHTLRAGKTGYAEAVETVSISGSNKKNVVLTLLTEAEAAKLTTATTTTTETTTITTTMTEKPYIISVSPSSITLDPPGSLVGTMSAELLFTYSDGSMGFDRNAIKSCDGNISMNDSGHLSLTSGSYYEAHQLNDIVIDCGNGETIRIPVYVHALTTSEPTTTTTTTSTTAATASTADPASFDRGDLNGDGTVSVADAVILMRVVMEDSTAAPLVKGEPDVNGDGLVSVDDVQYILQMLTPFCINVGSVTAEPGGTVQIPVCIYGDPGTAGGQLYFSFDPLLTPVSVKTGTAYSMLPETGLTTNPMYAAWVTKDGKTQTAQDGAVLLYLEFKVSEYIDRPTVLRVDIAEAPDGVHRSVLTDSSGSTLPLSFGGGYVTVIPKQVPGTTAPATTITSTTTTAASTTTTSRTTTTTTTTTSFTLPADVGTLENGLLYKKEPEGIVIIRQDQFNSYSSYGTTTYGYRGNYLDIPEKIEDQPVVEIEAFAFAGIELRSAKMPDSIMKIGEGAFSNCRYMVSAKLPANLTVIPRECFFGCNELVTADLPETLETIGDGAFAGCQKLTILRLPDTLTSIGEQAFASCGIIDLILPEKLKTIGAFGFADCQNLREIILPDSLESVGEGAFSNCMNLERLTVLNSQCELFFNPDTVPQETIICCVPGSKAADFAALYGRKTEEPKPANGT